MADQRHVELLRQGELVWNQWREENHNVTPDLHRAELQGSQLAFCNLSGADLKEARLAWSDLRSANLANADLRGVLINDARAPYADFSDCKLQQSYLWGSDFREAVFCRANLSGANLVCTQLIRANFSHANLAGCKVYGTSAWEVNLEGANQHELVITPPDTPDQGTVRVENLEVAQFINLLLHNEKIRDIIDTITTKAVLILGRFTPERKAVLDALRDQLRKRDRAPIVFDFDQPESKNITDTVKLLAQMARYIIVDLSDPNSAPYELAIISMLGLDSTPVVPLIAGEQRPFPMLADLLQKRWSTQLIRYQDLDDIRANLDEMLVKIAEAKVQELRGAKQAAM